MHSRDVQMLFGIFPTVKDYQQSVRTNITILEKLNVHFFGTQHNKKKNIPLLRVCSELIADPPADTGAPEWSATRHSLERTYTEGKTPLISPSRLQLHIIMSIYTLPNANGRTELGIC